MESMDFKTRNDILEYVKAHPFKLDILDELEKEKGYVRLVLSSGEIVFGKPDCIIVDEDDEEKIRFENWDMSPASYYGINDIESFDPYDEEDIPAYE